MKIEVTEKMREAVQERRRLMDAIVSATVGTVLEIEAQATLVDVTLARLLAEAVEREEARALAVGPGPCFEDMCERGSVEGSPFCAEHEAEHRAEKEKHRADREAGKPCGPCAFIGGECHACMEYRREKGGGDA